MTDIQQLEWDDREDTDVEPDVDLRARVLVLDDDAAMRALVRRAFEREGFDVEEASNAAELFLGTEVFAPRRWPAGSIDLLLVDLRMPVRSGLDVLSMLRTTRWTTPAILVTAFPDRAVYDAAEFLGVPVVAKPFRLHELIDTARMVLLSHGRMPPEPST
jgi:DNA-binding response OmpR family regulator